MPVTQVLHGKLDILSSNGLDASSTSPPTPNAIKAFSPESDPVVKYMHQQMQQYVKQMKELAEEMQHALQHLSDELATEIVREQQHLMLMQDQVRIPSYQSTTVESPAVAQNVQDWSLPMPGLHIGALQLIPARLLQESHSCAYHSALLHGQSQQCRHSADACAGIGA